MANFRIRVGFNRGCGPVEFRNLSGLTEQISAFLCMLGEDAGIPDESNRWVATKVADGSFLSTGTPLGEIDPAAAVLLELMAIAVLRGDSNEAQALGVRDQTRLQYASLAQKAANTKVPVELGLYKSSKSKRPKWYKITQAKANALTVITSPYIEYSGAIQGVIHAWFKESADPHFQLRELTKNVLVKCFYKTSHYPDLLKAVARRDEKIHVSGLIHANRLDKSIESVQVAKIKNPIKFSDADFEKFFGCAPTLTGDLNSSEYIHRSRRSDA